VGMSNPVLLSPGLLQSSWRSSYKAVSSVTDAMLK
jgi:hypothetical protein